MIDKLSGFRARFDLWIGEECATRHGYNYHCLLPINRRKSTAQWNEFLQPAGSRNFPMSCGFDITLSSMIIVGENFISAALTLRDLNGHPLTAMQMMKLWIPPRTMANKDDRIASVDEMSIGYWINNDKPAPAVLITYINAYYDE